MNADAAWLASSTKGEGHNPSPSTAARQSAMAVLTAQPARTGSALMPSDMKVERATDR